VRVQGALVDTSSKVRARWSTLTLTLTRESDFTLFVPGLHLLARSLVGRLMKKTLADGHCCHAPSGCTPLHLAAWGGRHEVVQLLLDHKADHSRTRTGHTALHWAAKFGASTRLSRAQRRNRTKRL
jgi:hypothetical protein